MILERSDGVTIDAPSPQQLLAALDALDPSTNEALLLHRSATQALLIVREEPSRYYLTFRRLFANKRTRSPVSRQVAGRVLLAYRKRAWNWQQNLRFETTDPEASRAKVTSVDDMSSVQLRLRLQSLERGILLPHVLFILALASVVAWAWQEIEKAHRIYATLYIVLMLASLHYVFRARRKLQSKIQARERKYGRGK